MTVTSVTFIILDVAVIGLLRSFNSIADNFISIAKKDTARI